MHILKYSMQNYVMELIILEDLKKENFISLILSID